MGQGAAHQQQVADPGQGDLGQLAAVVGAVGAAILLLSRTRAELLTGLAVAVAGEAILSVALIPGRDLKLFVTPATHLAALVVGLLVIGAGAWALVRYPTAVPVVLLAAAPFRISTSVGTQKAYLLDPLYVVLAAALVAADPSPALEVEARTGAQQTQQASRDRTPSG